MLFQFTYKKFVVSVFSLFVFFVCSHSVFAGTLTSFSYTSGTSTAGAASFYQFTYTIETANPNMINYMSWPAGFNLDSSSVSVTINGSPAAVGEYWDGGDFDNNQNTLPYIRLTDPTAATGAVVVVSYFNVLNPTSPGTRYFNFIQTADDGGNALDTPSSIDPVVTPSSPFTGAGTGVENDPYIITTCTQLQEMNNHLSSYFELGNDINCEETETWNENVDEWVDGIVDGTLIDDEYVGVINNGYFGFEPIGQEHYDNSGSGFTGVLDGQSYTISNLWIFRKDTRRIGLIGYADDAIIKNLTLNSARIVGGGRTGAFLGEGVSVELNTLTNTQGMVRAYLAYHGGGIAGRLTDVSSGTFLTVTNGTVHGSGNIIGGLVGFLEETIITDSNTSADVDGGEYIGGAFGQIRYSQVGNVRATGNVESNDGDDLYSSDFSKNGFYTGGFAGEISNSLISSSTATGLVTAEGSITGGFVGRIDGGEAVLENVSATGNVSGVGEVGGFAGQVTCGAQMTQAFARGNVTATGDYVGGFVGSDGCEGPGGIYSQVSAHGNVTTTGSYAGGFIGGSSVSDFNNAYASGNVSAVDYVGGFAGSINYSDIDNVYSRGVVTGDDLAEYVGGFAGNVDNTEIFYSYIDNDTSDQLLVCGFGGCAGLTGVTTSDAKTQSIYTGWDFENIWRIDSGNNGYPYFDWEILEEGELYIITEVTPISGTITDTTVTYHFAIEGTGDAELHISEGCGNNILATALGSNPNDQQVSFGNLERGETYQCTLFVRSDAGDSNVLTVGPFTIEEESRRRSSGGGSRAGVTNNSNNTLVPVNSNNIPDSAPSCSVQLYPTQSIRIGIQNDSAQVMLLEKFLNQFENANLSVDGVYSSADEAAVKAWQEKYATDILLPWGETKGTGYVYKTSLTKIKNIFLGECETDPTSQASITQTVRDLEMGMTGDDVKSLQTKLMNLGYSIPAGATGYFGQQTKDALIKYQEANTIAPASGYFGQKTRTHINKTSN